MSFTDSVVLVTGANRGIGLALTQALLARGVKRLYAAARDPSALSALAASSNGKIIPLKLDTTNPTQVADAAKAASDVTLLINNAGTAVFGDILTSPLDAITADMQTNYFGTLSMVRAFAPLIEANAKGTNDNGAIANVLSVVALAAMPGLGGYCASKFAAGALTQAIRGSLKPRGIRVHAIFPGPVDTDMAKDFNAPKASPSDVATAILDGIAAHNEDIFPDAMALHVAETWRSNPKQLEQDFAAY